jgi:hypothetical protein
LVTFPFTRNSVFPQAGHRWGLPWA